MKKLYILPASLMLLLVSCKSDKKETEETPVDPKKTDVYADKLNGRVKSVSEKSFSYTDGIKGVPAYEPGKMDVDAQYDEKGMLTSEKKYNAGIIIQENTYKGKNIPLKTIQYNNGTPGMITEFSYNKDGKKTTEIRRTGNNQQIDKIELVYKGKNIVEKNTYNNQNTLIGKISYDHDKAGNVIEENIYNEMQIVTVQIVSEYDGKGHKTGDVGYNNNTIAYKTSYNYDGDKLMSKITANASGAVEFVDTFEYDANGNITKHETTEPILKRRSIEINTYDKNNNLISSNISENNKPVSRSVFAYDKNGNLILVKVLDNTEKMVDNRVYTYTYDSQNNWIKKEIKINDKPAYIVERTVTYY
jgi:hypothetical protein